MATDTAVTAVTTDSAVSAVAADTAVTGTGTGTGTHKLYWHVTHLQSKLPKQYLNDL